MCLFSTASRPALGPTQPSIQWILGVLAGLKRSKRDADHSLPFNIEVKKMCGAVPPVPVRLYGVVLN
jgi:hypothetical protein